MMLCKAKEEVWDWQRAVGKTFPEYPSRSSCGCNSLKRGRTPRSTCREPSDPCAPMVLGRQGDDQFQIRSPLPVPLALRSHRVEKAHLLA